MQWELLQGNTGVIATRMALIPTYYLTEREIVLIDSGAERDPEMLAWLEGQGLRVAAVVCTHLHPDHIANNRELMERHGAEIFATQAEIDGAKERFRTLRENQPGHIWIDLAPDYPVAPLEEGAVKVAGGSFEILPTPGHTLGHVAIVTPDNVCCLGDAMMSAGRIERAKLPYMDDADLAVESLEKLRETDFSLYIAAHKGLVRPEDLEEVIDTNIQKELDLYELLRRTIDRPMEMEEAVDAFMAAAGVTGKEMTVNAFMRHTARIRVKALVNAGEFRLEGGKVIPRNC